MDTAETATQAVPVTLVMQAPPAGTNAGMSPDLVKHRLDNLEDAQKATNDKLDKIQETLAQMAGRYSFVKIFVAPIVCSVLAAIVIGVFMGLRV